MASGRRGRPATAKKRMMTLAATHSADEIMTMSAARLAELAGVSPTSARRLRGDVSLRAAQQGAAHGHSDIVGLAKRRQKHYSNRNSTPLEPIYDSLTTAAAAVHAARLGVDPAAFITPADDLAARIASALGAIGPLSTFTIPAGRSPAQLNALQAQLDADPNVACYAVHSPLAEPANIHVHVVVAERAAAALYHSCRAYGRIVPVGEPLGWLEYLAGLRPKPTKFGERPRNARDNGPVGPISWGLAIPISTRTAWAALALRGHLARLPYPEFALQLAAGRIRHGMPEREIASEPPVTIAPGTVTPERVNLAAAVLRHEIEAVRKGVIYAISEQLCLRLESNSALVLSNDYTGLSEAYSAVCRAALDTAAPDANCSAAAIERN